MDVLKGGSPETESDGISRDATSGIRPVAVGARNIKNTFMDRLLKQWAGTRRVNVIRKSEPDIQPAVRMGPVGLTGEKISQVLIQRGQHAPGFIVITTAQNFDMPIVQAAGHRPVNQMLTHVGCAEIEIVLQ